MKQAALSCLIKFITCPKAFYKKYFSTEFIDEKLERKYIRTFQTESQNHLKSITISIIIACLFTLIALLRLLFFSPFGQINAIKYHSMLMILLTFLWIVYSLFVLCVSQRIKKRTALLGKIHFYILSIICFTYFSSSVRAISEFIKEDQERATQIFGIPNEEIIMLVYQIVNKDLFILMYIQLFIWISAYYLNNWFLSGVVSFFCQISFFLSQNDYFSFSSYQRLAMIIYSSVLYMKLLRMNDKQLRSLFIARDESLGLNKLACILRQLPDGILITDSVSPLYLNQKASQILQIQIEQDFCSKSFTKISNNVQVKIESQLSDHLQKAMNFSQEIDSNLFNQIAHYFNNNSNDFIQTQYEQKDEFFPGEQSRSKLIDLRITKLQDVIENQFDSSDGDEQGKQYLFIFRDITIEQELQREKAMQQYSEIMLASVSHELRTPVNVILNCLKCLQDSVSESAIKWLHIAHTSASFLLSLVNDTLDFTQMKLGKFKLQFSDVDLMSIINDVADLVRIQIQLRPQVDFRLNISESLENQLFRTDQQRIQQIMINILRNSVKFTLKGYIQLSAEIVNDYINAQRRKSLKLTFFDTGIGIEEKNLHQLFQIFGKLNDPNQINKEGTGLGLYITKQLVEQLGGTLQIDSEFGQYTQFTVSIPQQAPEETLEILEDNSPEMGNETIVNSFQRLINDNTNSMLRSQTVTQLDYIKIELDESQEFFYKHTPLAKQEQNFHKKRAATIIGKSKPSDQQQYEDNNVPMLSEFAIPDNIPNFNQKFFENYQLQGLQKQDSEFSSSSLLINHGHLQQFESIVCDADLEIAYEPIQEKVEYRNEILIVDDNEFNSYTLQEVIRQTFKVDSDVACNGKEAFDQVINRLEYPYKLILMDCIMPIMDGFEATKKIKEFYLMNNIDSNKCKVVALSAMDHEHEKQKCYRAGMDEFITKPPSLDELKRIIIQQISSTQQQ